MKTIKGLSSHAWNSTHAQPATPKFQADMRNHYLTEQQQQQKQHYVQFTIR